MNNDTPVQVEKDKEEEGKNIELSINDTTSVKEQLS